MSLKIKSRWMQETYRAQETEAMKKSEEAADPFASFSAINENIYLTEEKKRGRGWKESKRMLCDCTTSAEERLEGKVACGDDCLNRILFIECGPKCACGEECTNRRFQERRYSAVEPFAAGKKGWGLRALSRLEKGAFVMEYIGEVLSLAQFRARSKRYAKNPQHKHHYFMSLRNDEVIDATEKGCVSRFINHSCDPNCETQKWTVNGLLRIGFFTRRIIEASEEITFDYQFQRYGKEAQECFCGAGNCRGFIGGEPTEEEKESIDELKRRERRRKAQLEDIALEKELKELFSLNCLRTREQVLTFSRLMVRGDDLHTRTQLLALLQTTEEPCLRLFLDYHGCWLIWSWMVDEENLERAEVLGLRQSLLQVLARLPIPHRNMLEDSRVLRVVTRWGQRLRKPTSWEEALAEDVAAVVRQLVDRTCAAANGSSTPSSFSDSSDELTEQPHLNDLENSIYQLSNELLFKWSSLREYFKIPKKTEAGKAARAGRNSERSGVTELKRQSALERKMTPKPTCFYNERKLEGLDDLSHSRRGSFSRRLRGGRDSSPLESDRLPEMSRKRTFKARPVKTPFHNWEKTKEERRRAFEASVAEELEEEQKRVLAMEFELAERKIELEMQDAMAVSPMSPSADPEHSLAIASSQRALPALLVADPNTYRYWWQDQASGTLVYPVTDEQLAGIASNDWSQTPHFLYDAVSGLIHEVKLEEPPLKAPVPPPPPAAAQEPEISSSDLPTEAGDGQQPDSLSVSPPSQPLVPPTGLSTEQQILFLQQQISQLQNKLEKQTSPKKTESESSRKRASNKEKTEGVEWKSRKKETQEKKQDPSLPPDWRTARDEEGNIYYYNTTTRIAQWEHPEEDEDSEEAETSAPGPSSSSPATLSSHSQKQETPRKERLPDTTTAAADTSSEVTRKLREKFKEEISKTVIKCLQPYQKTECKTGRITSSRDFKHLARKLSHAVMEKELKLKKNRFEELQVNDSVLQKAKEYIKNYMRKLGPVYVRSKDSVTPDAS